MNMAIVFWATHKVASIVAVDLASSHMNPKKTPLAVVVEDNHLTSVAMVQLLEESLLFDKVISFGTIRQFIEHTSIKPDFVLLDLSLPDGSGLDLVPMLRSGNPHVKILVLTIHQEQQKTLEALNSGVNGFLLKDEPRILDHVEQVLQGNIPIDSRVTGFVIDEVVRPIRASMVKLTLREHQVLDGLSRGQSYAQIADSIKVSENTITGYIKTLYKKLGVNSKNQAVYEGTRLGLVRV